MKHTLKVTIALVFFFFLAQIVGLLIVNQYIDHKKTIETQTIVLKDLPYGLERPQVENQSTSFIYIAMAILIGTLLLLLIIKTNITMLWKIIFFFSVTMTLAIAFAAFINPLIAGLLALAISFWRLYRPNPVVHNISEVFIYGGSAAFVVNIFNIFAAFMLLIIVSLYDYIAVYRTRHMIKLAEFQSKSRIFAGLFIPYAQENQRFSGHNKIIDFVCRKFSIFSHKKSKGFFSEREKILLKVPLAKKAPKQAKKSKGSVAVLGGGDIGFTLIFAGVVMKGLVLHEAVLSAFLRAIIIPVFATFALLFLLVKGQQNKFYPAMPILSLGCFIGYLVVLLV